MHFSKLTNCFWRTFSPLAVVSGLLLAHAHAHQGPQGVVEIDWPMEHIARTFSAGYPDSLGLYALPRKGLPIVKDIDGRRCVVGSFLALDVDDSYAFDIDEPVQIELIVDSRTTRSLLYAYDRNAMAEAIGEVKIPPETENRWHRELITLERARFANRGMGGSDIALVAPGAQIPVSEDDSHTMTVCSVSVKRSHQTPPTGESALIEITVLDQSTGKPTPARVGLYDATGRMPLPGEDALTIESYDDSVKQIFLRTNFGPPQPWPAENRYAFYVDGRYRARVPAGTYQLVVAKGPEFRVVQENFTIAPGGEANLKISVPRWDSMPEKAWYSGDAHIHLARTSSENERFSRYLQAEDVHVSNILEMNNPGGGHYRQYAWGTAGQYRVGEHVLVPGIESPRTAQLGHTISLNIQKPMYDRNSYFEYHKFFEEYASQGGLSGYAHVGSGEFRASWGLALDVPFGVVDFVEILQDGLLRTDLWYEFLNLGYELTPVAGSDFPYFDPPGAVRSYAKVEGEFTPQAWYDSLHLGHTFVTNGPMLEFTVNGKPMGSILKARRGDILTILASARINPDIDRLDRLELIVHGDRLDTITAGEGDDSLALRHELAVSSGLWIAARAYGKTQAVSHTAPIYVHVGDDGSWSRKKAPAIIDTMRQRLKSLADTPISPNRELEFWEAGSAVKVLWARQKPAILRRVNEALDRYDALLQRIKTTSDD
ncbi:MAG: CehA/McbA family metallohydrolase [Acidobacteriota bacterium]